MGRSGPTRRRGHRSFKAIRKMSGTGSASGAVKLASIWLARHLCKLVALGNDFTGSQSQSVADIGEFVKEIPSLHDAGP